MNVQKMLRRVVLYHRQLEIRSPLKFLPRVRLRNTYVVLDINLAELGSRLGWARVITHSRPVGQDRLLTIYAKGIDYYLLLANLKNWNQAVLINQHEIVRLRQRKRTKDLGQLYLAIKNLLYDSYFFRRQNDLTYSWKLYLKLGFSDLGFTGAEVERRLFHNDQIKKSN